MKIKLKDQFAIITGATGGIGKACAIEMAKAGCRVNILGRSEEKLALVKAEIESGGGMVEKTRIDLSVELEIQAYISALKDRGEQVSIIIHSAGLFHTGMIQDSPPEVMDRLYAVNVRGAYDLSRALIPFMQKDLGQMVFMNSSVGLTTRAGVGLYSASKYARRAIADSLRDEVNKIGIRVLSIYPGRTATEMQARIYQQEHRQYHPELLLQPEDIAKTIVHCLSLPNTAEITDIQIRPFIKS